MLSAAARTLPVLATNSKANKAFKGGSSRMGFNRLVFLNNRAILIDCWEIATAALSASLERTGQKYLPVHLR
ncbi:hypothetical protein ACVW02_004468 [Ewingella americana]